MVAPITAISGISAKRAETLRNARLGTMPELAAARPEAVRDALIADGHRVGMAKVEQWIAEARAIEAEEWHRAASFVVSFEARGEDGERQRRTVVEQTEVDAGPAPAREWREWECSQVCDWMLDRVSPRSEPEADVPTAVVAMQAEARPASVSPPGSQPGHQIRQAVLIGSAGERSVVVTDGRSAAAGPVRQVTRAQVTVEPGRPSSTMVTLRFRDRATGARLVAGPTEVQSDDRADLETLVPPGDYDLAVVAWDEYAQADPAYVSVPLSVEPPPARDG